MRESVTLTGVVLYAQMVGDFDKRLVILTGERGKITAFAHGARRPKSPLIAAANPFVFAHFTLYEGRDAYTLIAAEAVDYFSELAARLPEAWYGMYFLELASYYGREGLEAGAMVNLIYVALRALLKGRLPVELIRAVYELRMLAENGEYAPPDEAAAQDRGTAGTAGGLALTEGARYAAIRAASCPLAQLFSFDLDEEGRASFIRHVSKTLDKAVDKTFKSLAVIDEMR